MMEGDMERWRSYFRNAGVDIWSVIQEAIHVAAVDYPKDFRRMRGEIAETLFTPELAQSPPTPVEAETMCTFEEFKVGQGVRQMVEMQTKPDGVADKGIDDLGRSRLMCRHDEAEALTDELKEEHLVLEEINSIKEACIDAGQPEISVFEALHRLEYTKITVKVLEATEIAKKVKGLRKHPSFRVSALAKELVSRWRLMALEGIDAAKEATAVTITTTAGTECGEFSKQEGLWLPLLDEDAVLEARASSVDLSKLFSFIDEDMCGGRLDERETPASTVEPSVKDNPGTDSSDFDDNAHKWGFKMAEEANGLANQDDDNGLMVLNNALKCSGPGRPEFDTPRIEFTSCTGKSPGNLSKSSFLPKNVAVHTKNSSIATMKSDKNLADQKLEMAKRKLHKGYAEVENAKKQRTVKVLDVLDLPKFGQAVRTAVNSSVQTKSGPRRGFLSQNGRYS